MNCLNGKIELIRSAIKAELHLARVPITGVISQICTAIPDGSLYAYDNFLVVSNINEIIVVNNG